MNVTLFYASLENNELIMVAPIAPISANPVNGITFTTPFVIVVLLADHISLKFSTSRRLGHPRKVCLDPRETSQNLIILPDNPALEGNWYIVALGV